MGKTYKCHMDYRDDWKSLSGALPVRMTSDYLFRVLLQADEETLKAMVASLLHIRVDEVTDIEIINPIVLGESVDDKEFHLDVSAILNGSTRINLELQAIYKRDWRDRSLMYACRAFDQLNHGERYGDAKKVIQIAFTDFTLFDESPEFYSTYKLKNINEKKSDQVYNEKLVISNVDLTRIDLATDEDKEWGIDKWAKIFKAQSWEELKMLATGNKSVDQAVSSIWQLTEDDRIRDQIRRREENEREYRYVLDMANKASEMQEQVKRLEKEKNSLEKEKTSLEKEKTSLEKENAEYLERIAELESRLGNL